MRNHFDRTNRKFVFRIISVIVSIFNAHRYILGDLERAYLVIDNSSKSFCVDNPHSESAEYTPQVAQAVILFHLKALSDLGECECCFCVLGWIPRDVGIG